MGISDVMLAHPEWPEKGLAWLEAPSTRSTWGIFESRRGATVMPSLSAMASPAPASGIVRDV